MKKFLLLPLMFLAVGHVKAQTADSAKATPAVDQGEEMTKLSGKVDGLSESYLETKGTVDKLAKLKVGGYLQGQWQHSDSIGGPSKAGGNFGVNTDRRMMFRRGRLKTQYQGDNSKYTLEFEALPTGVSVKDAEIELDEPWLKTFALIMGVQDRPFGFEIGYSSSSLETPERTRFEQAFLNGEKDLGTSLSMNPGSDMGMLQYLNLKAGLFTGMGGNADEIDHDLDAIGRIGFKAPLLDLNLAIDGGFSMYMGSVCNASDTAFTYGDTSFVRSLGHKLEQTDRTLYGVDAQLYYDIPVLGGTSFRFEYEWGTMPTTSGSNSPYLPTTPIGPFTPATTIGAPPLYNRNVMGWYITWVQNLGSDLQAVVRYDMFDPNTDAAESDLGKTGTNLSAADVAFGTLGFGGIYHWSGNLKFVAYYDMVKNEEVNAKATGGLAPYTTDLNDNIFTFRAQVKF